MYIFYARNGLRPALDGKLEAFLGQRLFDGRSKRVDEPRPDRFGLAQFLLDLSVFLGLPVAQAQILELTLDRVQAQPVRKRRVHEVGLPRNLELLLPLHAIEGPHVVQTVGNLNEDHADVIAERKQHLPKILRLGALRRIENPRNLGQPVDDGPLPLAEHPLDVVQRHPRVLDCVVQQRTDDARGVEPHLLGAYPRHRNGMEDVGFTRSAAHVLVRLDRELPRLPDALAVLLALAQLRPTQQPPVLPGEVTLLDFRIRQGHQLKM